MATLTLTMFGGQMPASMTVRLWSLEQFAGESQPRVDEDGHDTVVPQSQSTNGISHPAPFSLPGTSVPAPMYQAVTVHPVDATVPVCAFRSGSLEGTGIAPNTDIEVVRFSPQLLSLADVRAKLPALPIHEERNVVDTAGVSVTVFADITSIDSLTLNANDTMTLAVSGTVRPGRSAPLETFMFSAGLELGPAAAIDDTSQVIDVAVRPGTASIQFASGSQLGKLEAALLNLFSGMFVDQIGRSLAAGIAAQLNASALQAAGDAAGGTLPPGVVLSVSQISISPNGVNLHPWLGAFNGVLSKLPQTSSSGNGTGSKCALSSMAALDPGVDLGALRVVRDALLAAHPSLAPDLDAYYRHGPEAYTILAARPALLRRAFAGGRAAPAAPGRPGEPRRGPVGAADDRGARLARPRARRSEVGRARSGGGRGPGRRRLSSSRPAARICCIPRTTWHAACATVWAWTTTPCAPSSTASPPAAGPATPTSRWRRADRSSTPARSTSG